MRTAYIIMAYKNPGQIERMIKSLSHPQFDFYIHIDKKIDIEGFKYLEEIDQVQLIRNRVVCNWGGFNFFKATLSALKEVLNNEVKYDFISLLSGQDYPIKTPEAIYTFFEQRPGISFISCESAENSQWWECAKDRYEKYHFTDLNFKGKYLLQRIINTIVPPRKIPFALKLYGGSKATWWTMTTDCARYVIATIEKNRKLNNFFRFSWGVDEFIIPTLVMNSPFRDKVVMDNYRYIDWSEGNARPKLLDKTDFEQLEKSDMLFARKFDTEVDSDILEKIDTDILKATLV